MQVYLIVYADSVAGDIDVVDDDSVNQAGTLDEPEEGVGCSHHVAIFVLQLGHEAGDEYNTASDRKG